MLEPYSQWEKAGRPTNSAAFTNIRFSISCILSCFAYWFHSYAWSFMVAIWPPLSQVHGRREENGFILAVSLLFFPEKKILRKPPLVISHWPEVCHMVSSICKEGCKAMEYLAFFRSYTRRKKGEKRAENKRELGWPAQSISSTYVSSMYLTARSGVQLTWIDLNWHFGLTYLICMCRIHVYIGLCLCLFAQENQWLFSFNGVLFE